MAMDRETGKEIVGLEELEQAVDEVLDTRPGQRIMRADYGSELFLLTDIGMDASGKARIVGAVAEALRRHEPRVQIKRVLAEGAPGELTMTLLGTVKSSGQQITLKR